MTVYFVTARELGLVKIGCTRHTDYRIGGLKTSSPADLKVEALLPGYYDREKELHEQFAEHRVRGEWFKITDEIEAIISSAGPLLMPFERAEKRKPKDDPEHEERLVRASLNSAREMLEEASRIFAKLDAERGVAAIDQEAFTRQRFYEPVAVSGGQWLGRYGIRGKGGHRSRILCADLRLTWDQADRLCDVLEEVREYALEDSHPTETGE